MIPARGKITTAAGKVDELPEPDQVIQFKGAEYRVLSVMTTINDGTVVLPKPEVDIEPASYSRVPS